MNNKKVKVICENDMKNLIKLNKEYINIRQQCLDLFDVDLASTDNSRKIVCYEQTNKSFIPNFKRNGIDGFWLDNETELKTAIIKKDKNSAIFQFHVMGDINHLQYLFVVMNKYLRIIRYYIITEKEFVDTINQFLENSKIYYLKKYGKVQKRDIITISEKFILTLTNCIINDE